MWIRKLHTQTLVLTPATLGLTSDPPHTQCLSPRHHRKHHQHHQLRRRHSSPCLHPFVFTLLIYFFLSRSLLFFSFSLQLLYLCIFLRCLYLFQFFFSLSLSPVSLHLTSFPVLPSSLVFLSPFLFFIVPLQFCPGFPLFSYSLVSLPSFFSFSLLL